MSWLHFFKTRPPSSKTLGLTFLLNARLMQRCYNCPWHIAVMLFSSIIFNFLYREWAHLTSHSFVVIRFWEMGSPPLRGGRLPCRRIRNMGLHPWKYKQKCNRHTRQMARTCANPYRCLSSPKFSLCSCWQLLLHHSFDDSKEPNSGVWSWTVGKVAQLFSYSDYFHYL